MKGAILEVVLVSAQGIDPRTFFIGHPDYYVIVECGPQSYRSKMSSSSASELEYVRYLRLRILKDGFFSDAQFVGETMIFLGGIMVEGSDREWEAGLRPTPFNVVRKDQAYQGQMTVAIKFIPNMDVEMTRKAYIEEKVKKGSKYWLGLITSSSSSSSCMRCCCAKHTTY